MCACRVLGLLFWLLLRATLTRSPRASSHDSPSRASSAAGSCWSRLKGVTSSERPKGREGIGLIPAWTDFNEREKSRCLARRQSSSNEKPFCCFGLRVRFVMTLKVRLHFIDRIRSQMSGPRHVRMIDAGQAGWPVPQTGGGPTTSFHSDESIFK